MSNFNVHKVCIKRVKKKLTFWVFENEQSYALSRTHYPQFLYRLIPSFCIYYNILDTLSNMFSIQNVRLKN